MSQRNPLNERYTNTEERSGKTRKSAASAKPTSKAAASVRIEGKYEEPKGLFARAQADAAKRQQKSNAKKGKNTSRESERRAEQAIRNQYYNVPTPEFKKWRRVWWALLIGSLVLVAVSFLLTRNEATAPFMYYSIAASYVCIFVAIILDLTVLRRMRRAYQDQMIAEYHSKKNSQLRKEAAALARQAAKEAEENPPEEEKRGLFRGLFTRKRATDAVAVAKSAQARAAAEGADADAAADKA